MLFINDRLNKMGKERHYTNRTNWLRASVLGVNDGIVSTSSLVIGVAAANASRNAIILAALAGLVAGACSMAAGEYVSVSSQTDVESADLHREKCELESMPNEELEELASIYENRGVERELALRVSQQLMEHNALEAHAREELGIHDMTKPRPIQAALASAASFVSGGILPLIVSLLAPIKGMTYYQYVFAIVFLALSGVIAAKLGGSSVFKSVLRICLWGTVAMVITALIGYVFGIATS